MSNLFTTYTDDNMVVSQDLQINYEQEWVPAQSDTPGYYRVTRYATKSYAFIALTHAAALQCRSAKQAQYTRAYKRIDTSSGSPVTTALYACGADVTPIHDGGSAWKVTIDVNETDIKHSATVVEDLETFFAAENGRYYDGGGGSALTLDSVTRSGTTAAYTYTDNLGDDFDAGRLVFQWKTTASGAAWNSGTTVPASDALYCKLAYGLIESNTLTLAAEE